MKTYELKHIGTIACGTYQEVSDIGMIRYVNAGGGIENDDLRMSIKLNGGYHVVLEDGQHIKFASNGDIHILEYVEVID